MFNIYLLAHMRQKFIDELIIHLTIVHLLSAFLDNFSKTTGSVAAKFHTELQLVSEMNLFKWLRSDDQELLCP